MLETLTSIFNNRELATGLWLLIIMGFVVGQSSTRGALGNVLRAVLQFKLVVLFSTLAAWLFIGILTLWQIGWWTPEYIKLTVLWYLFSGTVLLGKSIQNQGGSGFIRDMVADQFKAVALLEFIVVFYSFAFWKEMVFLPFMTVVVAMQVMSEMKEEYASVKKLLDVLVSVIGFGLIIHFVRSAINDYGTFFNLATVRDVTIPILYSLWVVPLCYLWWCHARWEEARIQLNQKTYHSDDLRSFARSQFLSSLYLRPILLKRAVRQFNLLPATSQQDVQNIIFQVQAYEAGRHNPPKVETKIGWSPYLADSFLAAEGYETNDFHNCGFDGEWVAESETMRLKNAGVFDTLVYRIKGVKGVVKTLQIKGSFKINPHPVAGLTEMARLCASLVQAATDNDKLPSQILVGFENKIEAFESINHHQFELKFSNYYDANILDVEFTCSPIS